MARARNIKPSFFTSEQVADNCPLGRLLFIGLWTQADYKGDVEWKARTLKIQILPWDDCDIKQLAINLDKSGLIRFYSDGNNTYLNIPNFERHQNPHKNEREKGSDVPEYSDDLRQRIDLNTLTINPDKSRAKRNDSQSDRADSLLLNPESPTPESVNPESEPMALKTKFDLSDWPELPTQQTYDDWLAMRKRIKADVSQTVINGFKNELHKAHYAGLSVDACLQECVTRNWRGFKYQWILSEEAKNAISSSNSRPAKLSASDAAWQNYLNQGGEPDDFISAEYAEIHEAAESDGPPGVQSLGIGHRGPERH